jgi:hypothetical protein
MSVRSLAKHLKDRNVMLFSLIILLGLMLIPAKKAFAEHNSCLCDSDRCGPLVYEKYCCDWSNPQSPVCGCTFFTSCGET